MITAHEKKLPDILGNAFVHHIPAYQRPYAWEEEQAEQLIEDLLEAADQPPDEPYFLGSIVVIRPQNDSNTQVVDGQQRLTTLTILCAVLRDTAINPDERKALEPLVFIAPNPYMNQKEAVRLITHSQDAAFFRNAVQVPDATVSTQPPKPERAAQTHMLKNAIALRSRIASIPNAQREALVRFLLNRTVLVMVETESRASALRIFRVLNDRGMDLSNADIIKADLLDRFANDAAAMDTFAKKWSDTEDALGRDGFEKLLDALRFRHDPGKKSKTLSESYADRFAKAKRMDIEDFFHKDLSAGRDVFSMIEDCDAAEFPGASRAIAHEALRGLSLLQNKDWVGVTLTACMAKKHGPELASLLKRIESLAWSMQLSRRYDSQRVSRYSELAAALNANDAAQADRVLTLNANERRDAWAALDGDLYGNFPTNVVRALLERLDRVIAQQPVQWDGIKTVEHILPQNPANGSWQSFDPAAQENCLHRLGNLVLLTRRRNSSASNRTFLDKKKTYFTGGQATYASVLMLDRYSDWTPQTFAARHAHLRDELAKFWGLG